MKFLDSKNVAFAYLLLSFFGGLLGFSFSVLIRLELSVPFSVLEENFYYMGVTTHGFLMLFYFLTTLASSFSNYLIPSMCCFEDMYFKQLNVLTFYIVLLSFFIVIISLFFGEGVMTGWTLYIPLSNSKFSKDFSLDILILGIHLFTIGSLLGAINIIITIFQFFIILEGILNSSPLLWSYFITSILIIFAMPSLSCVLTMLLLDRRFSSFYFDESFGGDPLLFQTIFWYFGHPEVYIIILPVFGIISHTLIINNKGFLYNKEGIVCSTISIGILSFLVFGHHMVTVGWGVDIRSFFMSSTIAISIPTGVKVFSWLFNVYFCVYKRSSSILTLILFIFYFSFGGVTGFMLSNSNLDFFLHDTWFVVGHLHMVLAVSAFLGFIVGMLSILEKYELLNLELNLIVLFYNMFFVIFPFSSSILFICFHILGVLGLPRRVPCYEVDFFIWNYIETFSFLGVWISLLFLIISIWQYVFDNWRALEDYSLEEIEKMGGFFSKIWRKIVSIFKNLKEEIQSLLISEDTRMSLYYKRNQLKESKLNIKVNKETLNTYLKELLEQLKKILTQLKELLEQLKKILTQLKDLILSYFIFFTFIIKIIGVWLLFFFKLMKHAYFFIHNGYLVPILKGCEFFLVWTLISAAEYLSILYQELIIEERYKLIIEDLKTLSEIYLKLSFWKEVLYSLKQRILSVLLLSNFKINFVIILFLIDFIFIGVSIGYEIFIGEDFNKLFFSMLGFSMLAFFSIIHIFHSNLFLFFVKKYSYLLISIAIVLLFLQIIQVIFFLGVKFLL